MLSTNFPRFVLMLIITMVSLSLSSQNTKEVVILYNTKPVLAEVTPTGNVNKIIRDEPDFLQGFTLLIQDYGQFIAKQDTKKSDKDEVISVNQSFVAESNDFLNIPFESGFATLTDKAIERLDEAIKYFKTNPDQKIILRTLSKNADSVLSLNRINSIRTYLRIKGLSPDIVKFETLAGDADLDEVKITFNR